MGQTVVAVICMVIAVIAGIWGFTLDHTSRRKQNIPSDEDHSDQEA